MAQVHLTGKNVFVPEQGQDKIHRSLFCFQELHAYGCHPEIVMVWVRFLIFEDMKRRERIHATGLRLPMFVFCCKRERTID